jgi:hypothetical protein
MVEKKLEKSSKKPLVKSGEKFKKSSTYSL